MSIMEEKKGMDMRTEHLVSLFVGLVFMILANFAGQLIVNMFGSAFVAAVWMYNIFLDIMAIIYIVIAFFFALSVKQNDGRNINTAALAVFSILQFLLVVFVFTGAIRIFLRAQPAEVLAIASYGNIGLAVSLLIGSVIAVLIRFLSARHSLKLTVIVDIIALILAIGVMALGFYGFHFGFQGVSWGIGLTLPLFVFLPCIGRWNDAVSRQQPYENTAFGAPYYQGASHEGQYSQGTQGQYYQGVQSQQGSYYQGTQNQTQLFCPNCGARFFGNKKYCDQCGTPLSVLKVNENQYYSQPVSAGTPPAGGAFDAPSPLFALLGFCIPIAGLILFLSWQYTFPLRAKSAGKGALAGVITAIVAGIILVILQVALMSNMFMMY